MSYLRIDAEAKGEITLGGGPVLANHLESAEYIRGTMLRGALAGLWPGGELGNDKDFLNLFCRGKCKFLGLFPVDKGKYQRFRPDGYFPYRMPLSMTTCKYYPGYGLEGHGYHDRLLATEKKEQCASCEAPIERVKGASFCYLHHTGIEKRICDISPSKGVVMRHGANRKTRRADYGKLYSYTVINKGERFVGWIAGEDNDLEMLKEKLSSNRKIHDKKALTFELRVGRSCKKNYLQCTMSKQQGLPYPKVAQALVEDKFVVVLLQTSAILLDRYFRPCTKVLPEFVFYGLEEVSPKEFEIAFPPFSAQSHIDSWSNVHGLPREPETAISAGSIFVFRFANGNDLSEDELCKIWDMVQIRGIGERRMEGFGQVLINPEISLGGVR